MIRIAGFRDENGRLVRNFVDADWPDIKNCPKCSNCKNHNTRAMKNFVNKEIESRGYFECHGLHDVIYARQQGLQHKKTEPEPLVKSPVEAWIQKYGINLDWEAKAALREAVYVMMKAEPERTTLEDCPHCNTEVEIPAYRASLCPECGERILPCSECQASCDWMEESGCSRFPK